MILVTPDLGLGWLIVYIPDGMEIGNEIFIPA